MCSSEPPLFGETRLVTKPVNTVKKSALLIAALAVLLSFSSCMRPIGGDSKNETTDAPKPAVTTEASTAAPEPEHISVNIKMVGDVLLHERVVKSGHKQDGTYNFDHLFANVKGEIESADIAIVNQEVILGGKELGLTGYPSFNGPFEVGDAIAAAGFDIVLHGTNHALDKGSRGIINCCNFWRNTYPDISFIGISDSAENPNNICIKEVSGIRIAFINYTYGTNGIPLPAGYPNAVTYLDEETIRGDTAYAKENADFTVVLPHWGTEYVHEPDESQKRFAALFAECGVDLVIGTHPHVTEPAGLIGDMPVYYSIGNFVNSTAETGGGIADRMVGAIADVTVSRDEGGKVYIEDYGVIATVTHLSEGFGGVTTYKLSDYTEELANVNLIKSSDPEFSLEYCQKLSERIFGNLSK